MMIFIIFTIGVSFVASALCSLEMLDNKNINTAVAMVALCIVQFVALFFLLI